MDLLQELLPKLDYVRVLQAYEPKVHGQQVNVKCPKCGHHDAYIRTNGPQGPGRAIMCRRENNCGKTTTLLEIATGHAHLEGFYYIEGLKKLAAMGGASFNPSRTTPQQAARQAEVSNRLAALEAIQAACRIGDDGAGANYMRSRNFDVKLLREWGFGYIEKVDTLAACELDREALFNLGFLYKRDNGGYQWNGSWNRRVLIPMRDRYGRLQGFSGRAIDETEGTQHKKYLNTTGLEISKLVATELAWALGKHKDGRLIATEGYLDPFKARQHGIDNVIGIGSTGAVLSADRWRQMYEYGVKELTLWLDNDRAGHKGLRKALENLDQTKLKPDVFVVEYPGAKDLDNALDVWREFGCFPIPELFQQHYAKRIHVDTFRARMFAQGLNLETEGDRGSYIRQCMEYDRSIQDPAHVVSLSLFFWPEVQRLSGLDTGVIMSVREELRRQRAKDDQQKAMVSLLRDSQDVLAKSGADAAAERLRQGLADVSERYHAPYLTSVSASAQLLLRDESRLRALSLCTSLGIEQGVLPTLDLHLAGLRGLILVGGASQTGKTVFLVQTMLEALLMQPNLCVLFVSLEMEPFVLRNRMRSYLSGIPLTKIIELYKPGVEEAMPPDCDALLNCGPCSKFKLCLFCALRKRDEAALYLEEVGERFRLLHELEPEGFEATVDTVLNEAQDLKNRSGCTRCMIIIDYMDLWEVDESRFKTENQQDRERVKQMIKLRDKNNQDPIIVVSEVRKGEPGSEKWVTEDDFMGSARKFFRADQAIIINKFNDELLWRWFSVGASGLLLHKEPHDKDKKDLKKSEAIKEVKQVRQLLESLGPCFPLDINVCKVRETGRKGSFHATIRWWENKIVEGLRL